MVWTDDFRIYAFACPPADISCIHLYRHAHSTYTHLCVFPVSLLDTTPQCIRKQGFSPDSPDTVQRESATFPDHPPTSVRARGAPAYSQNDKIVETVVGTVGPGVGTVVETVVKYIRTVRFLEKASEPDPLNKKVTVPM